MKCKIISGKVGSGKTAMLLKELSHDGDNLIVTNDPAVIYIEMYMARNKIPGRCIGVNSLAKVIAEDICIKTKKESSREVEMAIVSKIIHDTPLRSFAAARYNSGLANKIHSFITQCKEANVTPEDLEAVAKNSARKLEEKLLDMAKVYRLYDEIMSEKGLATKEDMIKDVIKNAEGKKLGFKKVVVDTLDRYNHNTVELLGAIVPMTENFCIAFNKTSKKAFEYDIYHEAMEAYVQFIDLVTKLPYCPIESIDTIRRRSDSDGINIIERELFSKDTVTKCNASNVTLHEASTLYKEVDFVVAEVDKLVKQGVKYSEIIITSSSMDRYINIIGTAMKKHRIPYHYFKNTTVDKTSLFSFIDTVLDIKENDLSVENLRKLCHLNFMGLTPDEIMSVDTLYDRFGDNLATAMKNGTQYDPNNTMIARNVIGKVMMPINKINDSPRNTKEFLMELYNYLLEVGVADTVIHQSNDAEADGFIHASGEIVNTWNDIMSLFSNIALIFGDSEVSLTDIRDILGKMASEKISRNGDSYHGQLTLLDIDNAQNRKSKYLFVIGCNEGYMPKPVGEHIVSDRERIIINNLIGKNLKLSSAYQVYKIAAIYNTLILPQEKVYISWAANDVDFKQLRYAGILNNVIKTFEDNIVREEDFYKSDEEERFINLLQNISRKRYEDKETPDIDKEFMHFAMDAKYNRRLASAMLGLRNETIRFNINDPSKGYREKEYFAVTRIEKYNECPFKHYVEYAIKPGREKLFAETAADKGNYNHLAFKVFFDKCKSGEIDMINISHENYLVELDKVFAEIDRQHNEGFLSSNSKNKYMAYTMKERIKTALWMAVQQLRKGCYKILSNEYVVGKNIALELKGTNGETYHITGVIDRVDVIDNDVRIIDYKSGLVEWSKDKQDLGIQMQLPLYAMAIEREDVKVTGMYYFRIKDFVADADGINAPLKEYKLSGPTLCDMEVFENNDNTLENGKSSEVIGAEITTKGEISKRSKTETAEGMHDIMNSVADKAVASIESILKGETKAFPLVVKNHDSCEYCEYKCLCGIDKTAKNSTRKE